MPRLFVAVEVPRHVRDAVTGAIEPLRAQLPRLRWVAPERYHLTLVFLGSVDEAKVPAVSAAVEEGAVGARPFELRLDGRVGAFGRRVLWAGLEHSVELASLAARMTRALGGVVELPDPEREFRAHLTLARAAGRAPIRAAQLRDVAVPRVAWRVDRVVLMRSAEGYHALASADLGVAGA